VNAAESSKVLPAARVPIKSLLRDGRSDPWPERVTLDLMGAVQSKDRKADAGIDRQHSFLAGVRGSELSD
jgi:hypothetical protein